MTAVLYILMDSSKDTAPMKMLPGNVKWWQRLKIDMTESSMRN